MQQGSMMYQDESDRWRGGNHTFPEFSEPQEDLRQSRLRSSAMSPITATTVPRMRTAASM
jgi:hypothetical protein